VTYVNGEPQSYKLGTYPQMKLAEATKKAREHWENPKKAAARRKVGTFQDVAEKWFADHVQGRLLSECEIRRHLERYVYPEWGKRRFLDIDRDEVNELLDHIVRRHGRSQADAVLATIRSIMVWHQIRTIVKGMKRDKRNPKEKKRERVLNDDEIRQLWTATTEINGAFGASVKMLLLTGQRLRKVAPMRWDGRTPRTPAPGAHSPTVEAAKRARRAARKATVRPR
jgi:integrase